jgi:hypothetical protein
VTLRQDTTTCDRKPFFRVGSRYGNLGKKMPDIALLYPEPQKIAQLTIMFGGDDCKSL